MKVLIAEDNALWRSLLEKHARSWGFTPIAVEDGRRALEELAKPEAPRLAILDWQMPEVDGVDVCKRLKGNQMLPFTYVIILTGKDANEDMVTGLNAGADDYLTKPVEPAVLRSRLAAAKRIVEAIPPREWSTPRVPGYQVEHVLGKGAFATVWRAVHEESGRPVALKILRVDLATDRVFSRFARETQTMQKLEHRNIARVYDSRVDRSLGYYAMELIEGPTLDRFVRDEKPRAVRVIELVAEVCDGLYHAHREGVIHRDLKPANIMVTLDEVPKLVDFGLSKSMFAGGGGQPEMTDTVDGMLIGTPLFMAPEQARGENQVVDGRADLYAVGIILYLLLLRRHPHDIGSVDQTRAIRTIATSHVRPPTKVNPQFDPRLERVILKALAFEIDRRYDSAKTLADDLRGFLEEFKAKPRV